MLIYPPIVELGPGPAFLLANTDGGAKVEGQDKPFTTEAELERMLGVCRKIYTDPQSPDWYLRPRTANNLAAARLCKDDLANALEALKEAMNGYAEIVDDPFAERIGMLGLAAVRYNMAVTFDRAGGAENAEHAERCRQRGLEALSWLPDDYNYPERGFLQLALEALPGRP